MNLAINHWVRIRNAAATADNRLPLAMPVLQGQADAAGLYRVLQYNYPKFFKMDMLCKWAWLGAEYLLLQHNGFLYEGLDKTKIAVVLMTGQGCIDVDKRYQQSIATIPSPALFVYTLPNIMLGEICIRHGFKGEQLSLVSDTFDTDEIEFWVSDLLHNKGMDACLCGWAEGTSDTHDICLFWVTKDKSGQPFSAAGMQHVFNS